MPVPQLTPRATIALLALTLGSSAGCDGADRGAQLFFDQPGGRSFLTEQGFCEGTGSSVRVSSGTAEVLPPFTAESTDPSIFTVTPVLDHPELLELEYQAPGEAHLVIRAADGGSEIEALPIRVHAPDGFGYRLGHPVAETQPAEGPARLPVGGGACSVQLFPYRLVGAERSLLYGRYEVAIGAHSTAWTLTAQGFQEPALALFYRDTIQYVVHASSNAPGSEDVTFSGPQGLLATVPLVGVEAADLTDVTVRVTPYYMDPPSRVGEAGTFVAVQRTAEGELCRGFPVTFTSETPDVLWIRDDGTPGEDHQDFELLAEGQAEVTATLPDRPDLTATLTFDVSP